MTAGANAAASDDVEDQELVAVGRHHSLGEQGDRDQHEERRILERFASFPSGSSSLGMGRPAALTGLIVSGNGCGGGSGSGGSTPKSIRKRNKRKGCDSPRQLAEDKEKAKSPTLDDSAPNVAASITTNAVESTAKNSSTASSGKSIVIHTFWLNIHTVVVVVVLDVVKVAWQNKFPLCGSRKKREKKNVLTN